jgi:hypothetical protein
MIHSSAIPFLVIWILFALVNARSCYCTHFRKRFTSSIPLFGGLCGAVGFYQIPALRKWCWIAMLVDYGSIEFLLALPKVVKEFWQISRINLLREFASKAGEKEVNIRLHKAGVFTIKHQFSRAKNEPGLLASSDIGSWSEADGALVLTLRGDSVKLRQMGEIWKVDRSFSHYPKDGDLEIQHLDFEEAR